MYIKFSFIMISLLFWGLVITGCSAQNKNDQSVYVINTYEIPDFSQRKKYIEQKKPITRVKYYEMSDGTWKTDEYNYLYKEELSGRIPNAVKDTTFIILTNESKKITFEQVWKSQLSSDEKDLFNKENTIIVAMG